MSDRPLSSGKIAALRLLKEAFDDAEETNRGVSEFAVSRDCLQKAGATESDLRWLLAEHLAEQCVEVSRDGQRERTFQAVAGLRLISAGCFVLTYKGKVIAETLPPNKTADPRAPGARSVAPPQPAADGARKRVRWDKLRHELRVDGKLAKRFLHAAPLQWRVLDTFQAVGWKGPIFVKLPHRSKRDRAQRLRELVKELNLGVDRSLLRFRKDPSDARRVIFDLP